MKAQIIQRPISCISKLLPLTITVRAHLMRPQPAWPLFLRSQRPQNANVYLITLPYSISFQYIIYSGQPCVEQMPLFFTMLLLYNLLSYIAFLLLLVFWLFLLEFNVECLSHQNIFSKFKQNEPIFFPLGLLISCIMCKYTFQHPYTHGHILCKHTQILM